MHVFAPLGEAHRLAGRIDWNQGVGEYTYAPSWLADAASYSLDPRNLPLSTGAFIATLNEGLHGVLADAGPDAWGRKHRGRVPETPLELLRVANGAGTGGLLFSQHRDGPDPTRRFDLGKQDALAIQAEVRDAMEGMRERLIEAELPAGQLSLVLARMRQV